MDKTIILIAKTLNELDVLWAFGGSLVLKHHQLVDTVNDIDIVIELKDAKKVDQALQKLGKRLHPTDKKNYQTEFFGEYLIQDTDVDVMAGFKIDNQNIYTYQFSKESITAVKTVDSIRLNYSSLEEWLVLYYVMNRSTKVEILLDYFNNTTMFHKDLFMKSLDGLSSIQKDELCMLLNKEL